MADVNAIAYRFKPPGNFLGYFTQKTSIETTPLHEACLINNREIVAALLQKGAKVNQKDGNGWDALHIACLFDHFEIIKLLLESSEIDINAETPEGKTPLLISQDKHVIEELLKHNPNITKKYKDGRTLLHEFCYLMKDLEIYKLILERATPELINTPDNKNMTPLNLACIFNEWDIIRLLLDHGAELKNPIGDKTLLHIVCLNGPLDLVQRLVDNPNVELNAQDSYGETPLMEACRSQNLEAMRILLQKKVDLNIQDELGYTALHKICLHGYAEALDVLLQSEVDIQQKTSWGDTALHLATTSKYSPIMKKLLDAGFPIDIPNEMGNTALMSACYRKGNQEIIDFFLKKGANPNISNQYGETALSLACFPGDVEMVKSLLDHSEIDVNAVDKNGHSPLSNAMFARNAEIVDLLLKKGAKKGESFFYSLGYILLDSNKQIARTLIAHDPWRYGWTVPFAIGLYPLTLLFEKIEGTLKRVLRR